MTSGKVSISQLPEATSVGVNDLLASTQADGTTRKVNLGQVAGLIAGGGLSFTDLDDTPSTYITRAGYKVVVNGSATALLFEEDSAQNVSYDNTTSGLTAVNVKAAIDELAATTGGAIVTADNGLTENPSTNVQLGGALIQDTVVGAGASGFDLDLLADIITIDADSNLILNAAGVASLTSTSGAAGITAQTDADVQGGNCTITSILGTLITSGGDVDISAAVLDVDTSGDIELTSSAGNVDIDADLQLQLTAQLAVLIDSDLANVQIQAPLDVSITSGQTVDVSADVFDVEANSINIDALAGDIAIDTPANLEFTIGNNVDLEAGSRLRLTLPTSPPVLGSPLVAANTSGDVRWLAPSYGEIGLNPGPPGTAFTVVTAGVPVQLTGLTAGSIAGGNVMTIASDRLVVGAAGGGLYQVCMSLSANGTANRNITVQIRLNGVTVVNDLIARRRLGSGGDVGNMGVVGMIVLVAGDTIGAVVDAGTSGTVINVEYFNINATRIAIL